MRAKLRLQQYPLGKDDLVVVGEEAGEGYFREKGLEYSLRIKIKTKMKIYSQFVTVSQLIH